MSETNPMRTDSGQGKPSDSERIRQVTVAGWTAGVSAFFAVSVLAVNPEWPVAVGVAAVAAMVAVVCYFMLKSR